jgi:hypothetical protein
LGAAVGNPREIKINSSAIAVIRTVIADFKSTMTIQKLNFNKEHVAGLQELGVSEQQLLRLRQRLQLIRDYLFNNPMKDVVEPLKDLLKHLKAANKIAIKLSAAKEGAIWEANGHLCTGMTQVRYTYASSTDELEHDELPRFVNAQLLLELITAGTEKALTFAPTKTRRPKAPVGAIKYIVEALDDPSWKVERVHNSRFEELCSIVFDAASKGKHRSGKTAQVLGGVTSELRPDVDRAIRGYIKAISPNKKPAK